MTNTKLSEIRERLEAATEWKYEIWNAAQSTREALDYTDKEWVSGLFAKTARQVDEFRVDIEALLRVAEAAQAVVVLELQDSLEWKLVPAIPVVDEVINDLELDRRLTEGLRSLATALDSLDLADPHPERQ